MSAQPCKSTHLFLFLTRLPQYTALSAVALSNNKTFSLCTRQCTIQWTLDPTVLMFEKSCLFYLFLAKMCFDTHQVMYWVKCVIHQVGAWSWTDIWESQPMLDRLKYFPVVGVNMAHVEWEQFSKAYGIHLVWLLVRHLHIIQIDLVLDMCKCIFVDL